MELKTREQIDVAVKEVLTDCQFKFWDIHTHLFTPQATSLVRYGIDELLNYHYSYRQLLGFRRDISVERFWSMSLQQRADVVWQTYFAKPDDSPIHALPVSEGLRAVSTILTGLGLDPNAKDLVEARDYFSKVDLFEYHDLILSKAGVSNVIGTNNPFDEEELAFYESNSQWHPAFGAALRLDDLVLRPKFALKFMADRLGCKVSQELSAATVAGARAFCVDWIAGNHLPEVQYVGISFPPDFPWLDNDDCRLKMLEEVVIPACVETGVSMFLMPEPVRSLEPTMKNAGDYLGKMDSVAFGRFCQRHPEVDIWVSPLNFSTQYEMSALTCVLPHVKPWSTWWYCHQPTLTNNLSDMRIEMHGENAWLFNSDARVLEHLYSKWTHFKQEFATIATKQLGRVAVSGYRLDKQRIAAWIGTLFDPEKINRGKWESALDSVYSKSDLPEMPTLPRGQDSDR